MRALPVIAVAVVLALGSSALALAQSQESLLVILPQGTRGELVDALRVELRGRGVEAVLVLAPVPPDADEAALELARAHGADSVLWLALADNPLEPPDARYLRVPEAYGSRVARLPSAADAIEPRLFALSLSELLDAPPQLESVVAPAPAPPPQSPSVVELDADDDAPRAAANEATEPASAVAEPPRIFRPAFLPRLAIGAGAAQASEPFAIAAALDLAVQLTPWLVLAADVTTWYAPGPDEGGAWVGLGLGGMAEALPGTLTIVGEGGAAVFGRTLGAGGGLVARWEWPIDWVVRLGPRVGFHVWAPLLTSDPQPPDVGWNLFIGLDVLGVDLRIG